MTIYSQLSHIILLVPGLPDQLSNGPLNICTGGSLVHRTALALSGIHTIMRGRLYRNLRPLLNHIYNFRLIYTSIVSKSSVRVRTDHRVYDWLCWFVLGYRFLDQLLECIGCGAAMVLHLESEPRLTFSLSDGCKYSRVCVLFQVGMVLLQQWSGPAFFLSPQVTIILSVCNDTNI